MTLSRLGWRLRALGMLASVLVFGAVALGGAPPALAIDEEPFYVPQGWTCDAPEGFWTSCDVDTGFCTTTAQLYCDGGYLTAQWQYPYDASDEDATELDPCAHPDLYLGLICP